MRKIIFLLILTFLSAAPRVKVSVDRNKIYVGDSISLTVKVEDGNDSPVVDISEIEKIFSVINGPNQSTNMQWINGEMTSDVSVSWTLMPKRKGTLKIPELKIKVDGKTYKSNPIEITVFENSAPKTSVSGNEKIPDRDFFLEVKPDKSNPYRGEQVTLTYTLYTQVDLTGFDIKKQPRYKGFWTNDLYSPKNLKLHAVHRGGKKLYAATVIKVALFPTRSGKIEIEPMTALVSVKVKSSKRSWSFFNRSKSYTIGSNAIDINVQPLPKSLTGHVSAAVGNWQIKSEISNKNIQQDEAVTLTVTISGTGNLQAVDMDEIQFPSELEVFDPEIKIEEHPLRDKIAGKKIIEYVLIPRMAKEIKIPAIGITYFTPNQKKWQTRSTQPIILNVTPNERMQSSTTGLTKEEVRIMGKDIRFADQGAVEWQRIGAGYFSNWTITLIVVSLIFFLLPSTINLSQTHFNATESSRKARKALKNGLDCLSSDSDDSDELYIQIQNALATYISAKKNKESQRSSEEIITIFRRHSIPETTIISLSEILVRGDAVRFSPVSQADAKSDKQKISVLLKEVENAWV